MTEWRPASRPAESPATACTARIAPMLGVAGPTPAGDLQRKAGRENRREPEHNLTNGRSHRTRSGDIAVAQAGATDCLWHAAAGVHGLARQHHPGERAANDRS